MDVEGIDPVAVYAALMSTLVRTVFAQPDAASAWAQHARVVDQLAERFPAAAELLADAAADLLAFTAFPKEHRRQTWSNIPPERLNDELAERVYRSEVCLLQQDHIGAWGRAASRFGPVSQPVRTAWHPQPGTQEIASSNYHSVLVFIHFIKLAFTIGIESSFQILEIGSQWPHRRALPLVRARAAGRRLDTRSGALGLRRAHRVTSPSFADTAIASLSTLGSQNSPSRTMAWSSSLVMNPAPFVVCRAAWSCPGSARFST